MKCLDRWATTNPQTVELLGQVARYDLRCVPFSGWHSLVYGVRPHTSDMDLFTHPDDFLPVSRLFPDAVVNHDKRICMQDRNGKSIQFVVDELLATLDGTTVQILRPRSSVKIGCQEYDLSLTDMAARHFRPLVIGDRLIWAGSLIETITAKALFGRGGDKTDLPDIAGLLPYCTPEDYAYLVARGAEIGFGPREYGFLGSAGLDVVMATQQRFALAA